MAMDDIGGIKSRLALSLPTVDVSTVGQDNQFNKLTPETSKTEKFADLLKTAIGDVNKAQLHADDAVEGLVKGDVNIHDAMIALQKADTSLKLMLEVRNKVTEAYQEVMRTQV